MAYKRFYEMSVEELKKLDLIRYKLIKFDNEKFNSTNYTLKVHFPYCDIADRVKSTKYYQIMLCLGMKEDDSIKNKNAFYRIVKGIDKNNKEFYQLQMCFGPDCTFSHLFTDSELKNLLGGCKALGKQINFVEKPKEIVESFDDNDVPDMGK